MAVYEEAGANDEVLQATAVSGNSIFVSIQTKTRRRRSRGRLNRKVIYFFKKTSYLSKKSKQYSHFKFF